MGLYVASGIGIVLFLTALAIRRTTFSRMDTMVRTGGYTIQQLRIVRKAVYRGRFPKDPTLRDVSVVYAKQAAQNLPYFFWWGPQFYVGVGIAVSVGYLSPLLAPFAFVIQTLCLLLLVTQCLAYWRVSHRVRHVSG
jgi:hypothetical protein